MERKLVLTSIIVILFTSLFSVVFRVEKAQASGWIYIRADGSIEGTTDISTRIFSESSLLKSSFSPSYRPAVKWVNLLF